MKALGVPNALSGVTNRSSGIPVDVAGVPIGSLGVPFAALGVPADAPGVTNEALGTPKRPAVNNFWLKGIPDFGKVAAFLRVSSGERFIVSPVASQCRTRRDRVFIAGLGIQTSTQKKTRMAFYDSSARYDDGLFYDEVVPPTPRKNRMAKIKLNLDRLSISDLLLRASDIKTKMTGNASFTTPSRR